jgi:hypothetical protein
MVGAGSGDADRRGPRENSRLSGIAAFEASRARELSGGVSVDGARAMAATVKPVCRRWSKPVCGLHPRPVAELAEDRAVLS